MLENSVFLFNTVPTRGIAKTSGLQGNISDLIKLEGFLLEFLENSWDSMCPPQGSFGPFGPKVGKRVRK